MLNGITLLVPQRADLDVLIHVFVCTVDDHASRFSSSSPVWVIPFSCNDQGACGAFHFMILSSDKRPRTDDVGLFLTGNVPIRTSHELAVS